METETPGLVATGLNTVEIAPAPPKPPRKDWWKLEWIAQRYRMPAVIAAALVLTVSILLTAEYLRLARMADRRLAEGPFSMSTEILSSPESIAIGDLMTPADLATSLERGGYSRTVGNVNGWFAAHNNEVQITPGTNSTATAVKVQFVQGRISNITSGSNRSPIAVYPLGSQLLTDLSGRHEKRRLVTFAEIPQSLVNALTAVEDKRFFQHGGFDYRRAVKAAYVDFRDGRKNQGASTLTMQLARALWLHPEKSWSRKVQETMITWHLEHVLSKQEIFEDYSNQIFFGRRGPYSINGFGEAARVYFGKELSQIDTAEAAMLAGMVQRPSYYNPYRNPDRVIARRNLVLSLMRKNGELRDQELQAASAEPLKLAPLSDESGTSYSLSMINDQLQADLGDSARLSRAVVTSLDTRLQHAAETAVRTGMDAVDRQLFGKNAPKDGVRPQVALIALDPRTGEIKALVGGRNFSESQLNHVLASRQPGSAFKPFVYAAAIETALNGASKTFTPATLVSDEATTFNFGDVPYQPKDFDGDYQGDVTLRTALALSLNVASVSLAQQIGYAQVVKVAHDAGLMGAQPTPSVALGTYEATPLDMAAAYTVFANHGVWVKPTLIEQVRSADGSVLSQHQPETRAALDPRVAYITSNMMQEVLRSGTGAGARSQGFSQPAAGKTGTSRDGWFAGFTSELLCVVWVGFDDNRDLKLEGARSALPIWAEFMKQAAQVTPYRSAHDFKSPSGVVTAQVCDQTGELAGSDCPRFHNEVFIDGTQPTTYCTTHGRAVADMAQIR